VKIANDLAAEEKEMAEYTEFCDKESSDKGYAIKTATSKIEDLTATIEKCTSKIPAYEDQIATLGTDVASKQKQLYEATELRSKEKADFDAQEKELVTAIDQLDRAVTIIKREMPSFAQMPAGTKSKKSVEVAVKVLGKIIDSGRISTSTRRQIEGLLQTGNMESNEFSFRAGQPQAKQVAYESKSGGIVEKIEEMKEKAEETLTEARSAETKATNDFAMLEQSLNNGITVANDQISTAKSASGLTTEELNKAKEDLGATSAAKAADEKALAELKHECETTAAGWAERQESARAEMAAINKAIEVLSEGVRVLLQTKSKTRKFSDDSEDTDATTDATQSFARNRLVEKLKGMSKQFGSYALMEMASAAVSDPFVKIRGLIEDMIAKLLKEAQEEATQKAFCDEEMGKSKASEAKKTMTLDKLNSRLDKASARVAELDEAIKTLADEIASLDAATAEATKIRNEEAATNAKAIKDFGDAAAATEKAIKILKDFYDNAALIQTGSTVKVHSKSSEDDDAPEFGSAKGDAGSVIIGILEMSNEDFVKLHSETTTSEEEAQEGYEKMMNDSKASKAAKEAEVKASKSEVKSLKVSLEQYGEDKTMVTTELDAVLEYVDKLKPQCEEKVMSYAEKKARREAEIAGLKEALEILSSEIALVQKGRSLRRVHAH
jgi:chromosome segregation ATPase